MHNDSPMTKLVPSALVTVRYGRVPNGAGLVGLSVGQSENFIRSSSNFL